MIRRLAPLAVSLGLVACGRLGFDTEDRMDVPDPPGPGPVTVTINVEGAPIAGAYVVVVDADGVTEVLRTDAAGKVATTVLGATTIHVAYELGTAPDPSVATSAWSVRSFLEIGGGTDLVIGGTKGEAAGDALTVDLPINDAATSYHVRGPVRCGVGGDNTGPMVTMSFDAACTGMTVPVLAASDGAWLDAGSILLEAWTSVAPSGTWSPGTDRTVRLDVPTAVDGMASAGLYDVRGDVELELGYAEIPTDGTPAVLPIASAPFTPDRVQITVIAGFADPTPTELSGHLAYLDAPAEVGGEIVLDASVLAPAIEYMAYAPSTRTVLWGTDAPPAAGAVVTSVLAFDTAGGVPVDWMFYAPGSATEVAVPVLPAPLDQLTPSGAPPSMYGVLVTEVDGRSHHDLVSTIDRDLNPFTSQSPADLISDPLAISLRVAPGVGARRRGRLLDALVPRRADAPAER